MEQFMPMELVKTCLKTPILKLSEFHNRQAVYFYQTFTPHGNMTLIVEQYHQWHNPESQKEQLANSYLHLVQRRNNAIQKGKICAPLVYEQQIKIISENYFICLTLTEPLTILKHQNLMKSHSFSVFEDLVQCAYMMEQKQINYDNNCFKLQNVIESEFTGKVFLDFTRIRLKSNIDESQLNFQIFKHQLCVLINAAKPGKLPSIFFIKQRYMVLNAEGISKARNWIDLAMMFNLLINEKVNVITPTKVKQSKIVKLKGCINFDYKGKRYEAFNFEDGYRTDGLKELRYDFIRTHFYQQGMGYVLSKGRYPTLSKKINNQQFFMEENMETTDVFVVEKEISKAQFIGFLIGYFRYTEPILRVIHYISQHHALRLQYVNPLSQIKTLIIKFSPDYVIRDEQVCMMIQKSRLKDTVISLSKMPITDSLLMFLANSDKMLQVYSLNISYCTQITDSGVHLLYASPMCRNIKVLKMCGLPLTDFSVVKFKKQLKQLHINGCTLEDEELNLSDWRLERLQALGVNINLNLPDYLWVLSISSEISLQCLKVFKNLSLTHLKVRIGDSKRPIKAFFNSLMKMRDGPVKMFAQGSSKNTLKCLDISNSTVKIRELRPMFLIQTMQTLILEGMDRDRFGECLIPPHIATLSFKNSKIDGHLLNEMLSRTSILIRLNLCGTQVEGLSLAQFALSRKLISLLEIDQEQLDINLIGPASKVQCLNLTLAKLIRDQHELLLTKILMAQAQGSKELNLICQKMLQNNLIGKVERFTKFFQQYLGKLRGKSLNIYINSIAIWKLIALQPQRSPSEIISVINEKAKRARIQLKSQIFIKEQYLQGPGLSFQTFNVFLHKVLTSYPEHLLQISLRSNRIIGKDVIKMINMCTAGSRLRSIDFRDCLFTFQDVREDIYEMGILESVNGGQYEIILQAEDNVEMELQKILKFFMRLRKQEWMKLYIKGEQIHERQLYYSILYEIINYHCGHIQDLSINFKNMLGDGSDIMWKQVFSLERLQSFRLNYHNDLVLNTYMPVLTECFKPLAELQLNSLQISTNMTEILPTYLECSDMQKVTLVFEGLTVTDSIVSKLIKNLINLQCIELHVDSNENFTSLSRVISTLEKMADLRQLTINVQNCMLKENQVYDLLGSLQGYKHLQRFQLNANNVPLTVLQLVKHCQAIQQHNRFCYLLIYALQPTTQIVHRNFNQLQQRGIQIIYT